MLNPCSNQCSLLSIYVLIKGYKVATSGSDTDNELFYLTLSLIKGAIAYE
tara:strand:- start:162 stop:311 length:150 start_codon:yes stop_codon:yes gene_type:complete